MLMLIIAIISIAFALLFLLLRLSRNTRNYDSTSLIGSYGVVKTELIPGSIGKVEIHGTLWNAESVEAISEGSRVIVVNHDNLTVTVMTVH